MHIIYKTVKEVNRMIELDQYRQDLANIRESIVQAGESL